MDHAIQTRALRYRAGKDFEIHDLGLNVPTGSVYGFLGPNGSGKTTTIRLLLGLLRPGGGSISVLAHSMPEETTVVLAQTGYVPERPHLYPSLTIDEAMQFHAAFFPTWDWNRARELTNQFGLRRDQRIGRLSKGETGKTMMMLALAQTPSLLILDEPTDGLDPLARRDVLSALLEYVSGGDATVFISSHLVHELERVCDWVGVLDRGRLVSELPMTTFKNGLKRLRVGSAPATLDNPPFTVLARESDGVSAHELWLVRGWQNPMREYLADIGADLREVVDLDLEDGFVELLRTARTV